LVFVMLVLAFRHDKSGEEISMINMNSIAKKRGFS